MPNQRKSGKKAKGEDLDRLIAAGKLPETRAGQKAWVRRTKMPCLGPFQEGVDPTEIRERIHRMRASGALAEASALSLASRKGCGYDFSELVANGPLDGEEHSYTCPRCGVEGTYRAPHFNPEETSTPKPKGKARRGK